MHSVAKSYLGNSKEDLYTVCGTIDQKIRYSVKNYDDGVARSQDRPSHVHRGNPLLSKLVGAVTLFALDTT